MKALAMPVTRFVAPGPEVATQTPTRPEARAYPLAAKAAPCSWRTRMWLELRPHDRVVEGHDRAAGIAEDVVDPFGFQGPADEACAFHDRHNLLRYAFTLLALAGLDAPLPFLPAFFGAAAAWGSATTSGRAAPGPPPRSGGSGRARGASGILRTARLVLEDPFAGELRRSGSPRGSSSCSARTWSSTMREPAGQVAVLRRLADELVHAGDAALIDQVDDQLDFVEALEIRHLGLVPGLDQRLPARLESARARRRRGPLARRRDPSPSPPRRSSGSAGARAADGVRVRQRGRRRCRTRPGGPRAGRARPGPLHTGGARGRRGLWARPCDVHFFGGRDLAVVDVEAVGKEEHRARLQVRGHFLAVERRLRHVRREHHDHVRAFDRFGRRHERPAVLVACVQRSAADAGRRTTLSRCRADSARGRGPGCRSRGRRCACLRAPWDLRRFPRTFLAICSLLVTCKFLRWRWSPRLPMRRKPALRTSP